MNKEIQAQLQQYAVRDNFPPEEWERRGLLPSSAEVQKQMDQAVKDFADFLQGLLQDDLPLNQYQSKIQAYLDDWDSFDFDTEETAFILDVKCELIQLLGVNCQDLLI